MDQDAILTMLVEKVPETRPLVEEKYGLGPGEAVPVTDTFMDLYGILLDVLTRGVLQPALLAPELDADLLRRCFEVVEEIWAIPSEHTRGAVYFQVLECLLDAEGYLENAVPFLRGDIRERVSKMCRTYAVKGFEDGLPPL